MSIGKTLLAAILGVSMISVALMTLLAYSRSETMLQREIRQSLRADAADLMRQVDAMLFERLQDLNGWRKLDIMQDTRVGDVDKRLSNFLAETRSAYGAVYEQIFCVDVQGRIVASSSPAMIGQLWPREPSWRTVQVSSGAIEMTAPQRSHNGSDTVMAMRTTLSDAYTQRGMGELYALLNWNEIQNLLEQASRGGNGSRHAVLLDADGRMIAATASILSHGAVMIPRISQQPQAGTSGTVTLEQPIAGLGTVEAGFANSNGYQQVPGFGWQVVLMEPKSVAFSKIAHLLWALLALLAATMLVGALMATVVARKIARPIQQLTYQTRHFQAGGREPMLVASNAGGEIAELARAFAEMMATLKASEHQLVQAAKLTVVGEMAAIMAHEVRTPLGILRSSGQLLSREPALTAEGREMVEFVLSETDRLNRLITSLIDCARPRPPHFEYTSLHNVIGRAVDLVETQANSRALTITTQLHAVDITVWCDPEQLLQVFLNLLMNAAQATSFNGRILVTTKKLPHSTMTTVEDDGPGISEEKREQIFDPFVSYRTGGIGLGLTVVRQIVTTHGATIEVGKGQWGGAEFRIDIPDHEAPNEAQA